MKILSALKFAILAGALFASAPIMAQSAVTTTQLSPTPAPTIPRPDVGPVVIDCSVAQCIQNGKPVGSVSIGTISGEAIAWLTAAFGSTIGAALTAVLVRMFKRAGLELGEQMSEKLQRIVVNGINAGAAAAQENLRGKGRVEIKNETVARAVEYTQAHAAETIVALGLDPNSGRAVEAIKARIETAISDPTVPTPAILDAPGTPPKDPATILAKVTT